MSTAAASPTPRSPPPSASPTGTRGDWLSRRGLGERRAPAVALRQRAESERHIERPGLPRAAGEAIQDPPEASRTPRLTSSGGCLLPHRPPLPQLPGASDDLLVGLVGLGAFLRL